MPVKGAVVVVDPFSSGSLVAAGVMAREYRLVMVFSDPDSPLTEYVAHGTSVKPEVSITHEAHLPEDQAVTTTAEALKNLPYPIVSVVPGRVPVLSSFLMPTLTVSTLDTFLRSCASSRFLLTFMLPV